MSISDLTLKEKGFYKVCVTSPLWNDLYPSHQQTLGFPSSPMSQPRYRHLVWELPRSHSLKLTPTHHLFPPTPITNLNSFLALLSSTICKASVIYLTSPVCFLFNLYNVGILSVFSSSAFSSVAGDNIIWTNNVIGPIHSIW